MGNNENSQGDINTFSSLDTNESKELNQKNHDLNELLSDIENSNKFKEALIENSIAEASELDIPISTTIDKTDKTLLTINSIKKQLCDLPLNPFKREYYDNSVLPLLQTIDSLSRVSFNLSGAVAV